MPNRLNVMTTKKQKFENERRAGVRKIAALQVWDDKGMIRVHAEEIRVDVNYLLWHSYNTKGMIQLCNSLSFYVKMKRAAEELPESDEYLTICVDYGAEENDYKKLGIVKMVRFHPVKGFEEV